MLRRSQKTASIALVLMAATLAGCVDAPVKWHIPHPAIGQSATYSGSDGSTILVQIMGEELRLDAYQRERLVVVLSFELHPSKNPEVAIRYEEAVDAATGLHVRQDVDCLFPTGLPENPSEACKPEFVQVFMGGDGLPGGLAMAPLWGKEIPPRGSIQFEVPASVDESQTLVYAVEPVNECLRLHRISGDALAVPSWMPGTVLDGPITFCGGDVLPIQFVSHMKMPSAFSDDPYPVFTRESIRTQPGGTVLARTGSAHPSLSAADVSQSGRLYLLSDDGRFTNFSSAKAHREAVRLDSEYKQLFDDGASPAYASHGTGGRAALVPAVVYSETAYWDLALRHEDGRGHQVRVQQTKTFFPDGTNNTSYEAIQSKAPPWEGQKPSAVEASSFVDPARAYELGSELFGRPLIGAIHRSEVNDGGLYFFPRVTVDDRFWATAAYQPPDAPMEEMSIVPWMITIDALTGAVVHVQAATEHRGDI